ncbi:SpvB/TcaC N-terminal domain-containing protein [Paludibacterium purpuratum]|uniref:RHS repeat-associated protein n=1 Tax=Paludibacterium purpuratum TaxID=1144873 RepID=A0A4R7BCG2_9NEIS|nr:SpvB/TcaC N-terminal domain-containing protein [Paludibacterium purpuratum]TDR82724.1 RHS repeat-associated protein [Paludibacterium purpuratum]
MPNSNPVMSDASPVQDSGSTSPVPDLPKGGGAVRGIGEKFAVNPVTGTSSLTLPIACSPGRAGATPQLVLSYDSGTGNGPFGMGWQLGLPTVSRRTDKGLPQYRDDEASDSFLLSGAEDLVPVLLPDSEGGSRIKETHRHGYRIRYYRPRIEGMFSRIERWTRECDGDTHWRSFSRDNALTIYGATPDSRISDPSDPRRVFSWLICQSYDAKGNAIDYRYLAEDQQGVDLGLANERNRLRGANRYLKSVRYGNRRPLLLDATSPSFRPPALPDLSDASWLFELLFDYGEGHYQETTADDGECYAGVRLDPLHAWPARADPFSGYRAGFEVRHYRLCRRVLMLHHLPEELGVADYLVSALHFNYREKARGSQMIGATQSGYQRLPNGDYLKRSWPELTLDYSESPLDDGRYRQLPVQAAPEDSLDNLPAGIDLSRYRWVDLNGEGIAGVLTEQGNGWFYKPNLGEGMLGAARQVSARPSLANLNAGRQQLLDLYRDGNLALAEFDAPNPGFYPRGEAAGWQSFRPFPSLPDLDWRDANLRFIDLTGDGHPDILLTRDTAVTLWHESLGADGFGPERRIHPSLDEESGPRVVFADGTQSVFLADMSGDGLTDLVRIRNGEVCYWPNIGYGQFGPKVCMDNAPWFDERDSFDQRRILLADIEGYGTTDILYRGRDGIRVYLNRHGNSWSEPRLLAQLPATDSATALTVVDFLGRGTACLLWSSPLPGHARRPLWYLDLMAGGKPHLLVSVRNNLGAETRIDYASSTHFYLEDQAAGTPWITRLPFPVHVVARVETRDLIDGNRFVTRYAYHHGHYDGLEREFRGFARVDQWDTEAYGVDEDEGAASNFDPAFFVPPVLTKTWYHTGALDRSGRVSRQLAHEYYRETGLDQAELAALLLDDTVLPPGLTGDALREAVRALKGARLRQEVYALDDTPESTRPYSVSEANYTIVPLQPRGPNRYAVFFTHARETLSCQYERKLFAVHDGHTLPEAAGCSQAGIRWLADPRIKHDMVLRVDAYGNVLQALAIAYGRRYHECGGHLSDADRARQRQMFATLSQAAFTGAVDLAEAYRTPLRASAQSYELIRLAEAYAAKQGRGVPRLLRFEVVQHLLAQGAIDLPYEDVQAAGAVLPMLYRRLIDSEAIRYRGNDLNRLLPLGELESLALPGEGYRLAFTPGLIDRIYRQTRDGVDIPLLPDPATLLGGKGGDQGGYVDLHGDGHWWMPSGRSFYHPDALAAPAEELAEACAHFFFPRRFSNAFGAEASVDYLHDLLVAQTRDALGNTVSARYDFRVLHPSLMIDPNGNRQSAAFDALGRTVATAIGGKDGEGVGDSLDDFGVFDANLDLTRLQDFAASPEAAAAGLLKSATTRFVYDPHRYRRCGEPPFAATLAREMHVSDLVPDQVGPIHIALTYSDGFGREIQSKIQAEPGPGALRAAPARLPDGDIVPGALRLADDGLPLSGPLDPRWVGKGRTVFNNKGKPVKQYQPFFSSTHLFEPETQLRQVGVTPIMCYDPLGRLVMLLMADHSYRKVVIGPWQQQSWDANDTVLQADPAEDPDVGGYFRLLPPVDYLPTWYASRADGQLGADERNAALRAAEHAATPPRVYQDALGHDFLSLADNGRFGVYATRSLVDIEGNLRQVIDALGRTVALYDYDMLGHRIRQASMEAGERWMLHDVSDKPIRAWDSRGHGFRTEYDRLRRSLRHSVRGSTAESDPRTLGREVVYQKTEYGEAQHDAAARNLRTRPYRQFDAAGIVTSERYDFKGNVPETHRQLLNDYKDLPDWDDAGEVFSSQSVFDALNRPVQMLLPYSQQSAAGYTVLRPAYNRANLLDRIDCWLDLPARPSAILARTGASLRPIEQIDYDAQGRRTRIVLGNGVASDYDYDPLTLRLRRLATCRGGAVLQDLSYVYDAVGNITRIGDDAQQSLYFDGAVAQPGHDYLYDPLYRLIAADGREFVAPGQDGAPASASDVPRVGQRWPGNPQAIQPWCEEYLYDAVGNLLQLLHHHGVLSANLGEIAWQRHYHYDAPSLIDSAQRNNRLSHSAVGRVDEHYRYDAHGNIVGMPRQSAMSWDFKDQLHCSARQAVRPDDDAARGETTWYVYDAGGDRVRKVTERFNGRRMHERIYLGGIELYREYDAHGVKVQLARETLHVMDGKRRVAMVETRTIGAAHDPSPARLTRYQLADHLDSSCLELDEAARLISYEEYYPYGSTAYQSLNRRVRAAAKRYRYTAMERDEETGFCYHRARYYLPWLGRWLSCDPLGIESGVNLYAYANGNPVANTDTNGTACDPTVATCMDFEGQEINFTSSSPLREVPFAVHVDEIDAVRGDLAGGVAGSPSDPANKQLLDCRTNTCSKSNYVGSSPPPRRPAVSIADNPEEAESRLLTGRLDEIEEIRDLADQATANTAAGRRTNAALRYRIARDPAVGRFLRSIGINPDDLTLLPSPNGGQRPTGPSVNFSPRDADINPATGEVIPGPNTDAAMARRAQRLASQAPPVASVLSAEAGLVEEELASHVAPPAAPPRLPAGGGGGSPISGAATQLGVTLVPGTAESLLVTEAAGHTALQLGLPRLGAAALSGAESGGPAALGGLVGAPAGYVFEGVARENGASNTTAIGVGTAGAVATGATVAVAAVLIVATAPVSLTVIAGAAIVGGLAAGFGYLMSHAL